MPLYFSRNKKIQDTSLRGSVKKRFQNDGKKETERRRKFWYLNKKDHLGLTIFARFFLFLRIPYYHSERSFGFLWRSLFFFSCSYTCEYDVLCKQYLAKFYSSSFRANFDEHPRRNRWRVTIKMGKNPEYGRGFLLLVYFYILFFIFPVLFPP